MRDDDLRPKSNQRYRNDSMNSTQSDSDSQSDASSTNSLEKAYTFEEMYQSLQNLALLDWSEEMEKDCAMQKEMEEKEQRLPRSDGRNLDEWDRESPVNSENTQRRRQKCQKVEKPRRYHGEHDDRDENTTGYTVQSLKVSGRLAGRITTIAEKI
uniref:Ovule protein n=1 Tax=Caenorhabditis tropicalis TaxID=1561998 RepID=A0A1I7U6Y4_9PELO